MTLPRRATVLVAIALGLLGGAAVALKWSENAPSRRGRAVVPAPSVSTQGPSAEALCEARRQQVLSEPALEGAPDLEARRAELVARAKGEAVLFLERPQAKSAVSPTVARLRAALFGGKVAWQALNAVNRIKQSPQQLREVLLTDGYLYAETPELAFLLASSIVLSQIFTEPELVLTRGSQQYLVVRRGKDYVFGDGPNSGEPARLWLFDRVAVRGEALGPNRHVAFADLRERLGATRVSIERMTARGVAVRLHYAEYEVPALLATKDGRLQLECESVPSSLLNQLRGVKEAQKRRSAVVSLLRQAIDEQVSEALPFDEPKTEEGQQDGKLRQEWRTAYREGRTLFEFNGDKYPVFDSRGRPRIPQVCVDFITDTLERMGGTHFGGRNEPRKREVGKLDFDSLDIDNRRSVERFIAFAESRPDWFEVLTIPESERVPFGNRAAFFTRLHEQRDDYRPGDIVVILGPRDDERLHYHSFYIVADDPITAMPTWVASNAGRPRIRTWENEMQNAPRRAIVARLRPRTEWLESIAGRGGASGG